jgi:hypothetical protein
MTLTRTTDLAEKSSDLLAFGAAEKFSGAEFRVIRKNAKKTIACAAMFRQAIGWNWPKLAK